MKKRLLSAFLAVAMVLTLIPATMVTAFAVDWTTQTGDNKPSAATYIPTSGDQTPVNYAGWNAAGTSYTTVAVTRCTGSNSATGQQYGHWYWQANKGTDAQAPKYMEVQSGIVAGTNGSGQWYPDVATYSRTAANGNTTVNGAFTVLGVSDLDLSSYKNTSLTIDFANSTDSLTIPDTITSLTLTAKFTDTASGGVAGKGHVGAITTARGTQVTGGTNTGLTVNATNIDITSINLAGRANTLNLTDCAVGAITMDGETITNVTTGAKTYNAQSINAKTSTITGAVNITNGQGGTISLTDTNADTNAINVQSDGATITVAGLSTTGTITATPRTNTGAYPRVTISGGSVAGVTQDKGSTSNGNAMNITVSGTNTNFGAISASNGTVNITDANGTSVELKKGGLTIAGSGVDISGVLTLGATDKTTLSVTAGSSTFGGITAANGANLTINSWNGKRQSDGGNDYGVLALGNYDGKKVTGGTFTGAANATAFGADTCLPWLDTANLQFFATVGANKYALYSKSELARAISDAGNANAITGSDITVLAQATGKNNIVLMNGNSTLAKIGYNSTTPLILPQKIDNINITTWIATSNHNVTIPAGTETNVPFTSQDLVLNATGTSTAVSKITKATTTASSSSQVVVNQNVTVTLSGNNINLSGAVTPNAGGIATVYVDLETDVVQNDGTYLVLSGVIIDYNVDTKKVSFNVIQPATANEAGALVQDGALVLNYGTGERYTVSANLAVSASRLGIVNENDVADKIVVTFGGKLASWTAKQKEDLTNKLIGTNSSFSYGANQAMQQAINAAQATITNNNSVESWITNAKNTIWRSGFKSPDTSLNVNYGYVTHMAPHTGTFNTDDAAGDGTAIATAFDKAFIVPYLVINVTDYDAAGTMTATLTPYFRVDVSASGGYDPDMAYTVQAGRALNLTGDITSSTAANQVKVKFGDELPATFDTQYMHQDGKYVYTGVSKEWTITHVGANGTLGTVVINSTPGYVSIANAAVTNGPAVIGNLRVPTLAALACTYDTLQAAIDDTVRGQSVLNDSTSVDSFQTETMDTIVIDGKYTGSCAITMSGMSRNVYVVGNGQQDVTCNTTNVDVQFQGGYRYLIQMKQDVVAAGTVAIGVTGTTAGTASVSASSAKAGQTVTVTVLPNAGQTATGVTIRTNTGATVTATPTGTANEYSFTVPTGATSVTVTPVFGAAQVNAVVTVANPSTGSGSAVTSVGNTPVPAGTVVTVTTVPGTNQRTMGIAVNGNSYTATRTGVNTFQFTVPNNVTSVVVTPSFDTNNGTVFNDVWSSEYYSKSVAWAVSKGITDGTSTYTFSPGNVCTRAQMMTFLWRAAGKPVASNVSNPFVDVYPSMGSDYYNAILWAVSKGITDGTSATTFSPSQTVTRAQAVTFLYRYAGSPAASTNTGFADAPATEYYARAVSWAASKGITNGKTSTTFSPGLGVTRAEAVTFLYRDMTGDIA